MYEHWMDTSSSVCIMYWATSSRAMQLSSPSFLLVNFETHLQYWMCLDYNVGYVSKLCILQHMHEEFPSLRPALQESPPGEETQTAGSDEGDWHMSPQHTVH